MGMRHPGAQYVVDRDGTIYQAVDPDLATVHVNIFKTLPGINNDNSIGIEMNHTGSQDYPMVQRDAVIRLVGFLKHRYNIDEGNIITHRYAQQGDHTDPVNFDWDGFLANVNTFHNQAIAYRNTHINEDARRWQTEPEVKVNTYLKPHKGSSNTATQSTNTTNTTNTDEEPVPAQPPEGKHVPVVMPGESPVPEPSEVDNSSLSSPSNMSSPSAATDDKAKPVEMKVYPPATKAPLPGASPSPTPVPAE